MRGMNFASSLGALVSKSGSSGFQPMRANIGSRQNALDGIFAGVKTGRQFST
jgi:hypothetical protein